jgi:hypothetical protein
MNRNRLVLLTRAVAVWLGAGAVVMGATIARSWIPVIRRHVEFSAPHVLITHVLITLIFGGASILGVVGAAALWRRRQAGRLACVISGAALIIGVGPAAILRGEAVVITLLAVTLAAVLWLWSRPAARFCGAVR